MRPAGIGVNADASRLDGNLQRLRSDLEMFTAAGFTHVEIPAHGTGAIRNGSMDRGRLTAVKRIASNFSFRYTVHGPNPLNLMDEERSEWQFRAMVASLDFAAELGADVMVYHAGRFVAEESFWLPGVTMPDQARQRDMLARERDALARLGERAEALGVAIAVENARPYLEAPEYCYAERLDLLAGQIREVNHPAVRIALDTGHAWIAANTHSTDLIESVRGAADLIVHIHLHDNFGLACSSLDKKQPELLAMGRGDLHLPPGDGSLPLADVLLALPEYTGALVAEMRPCYWGDLAATRLRLKTALDSLAGTVQASAPNPHEEKRDHRSPNDQLEQRAADGPDHRAETDTHRRGRLNSA
jgi:sugar phosphate isomerase/epimerase